LKKRWHKEFALRSQLRMLGICHPTFLVANHPGHDVKLSVHIINWIRIGYVENSFNQKWLSFTMTHPGQGVKLPIYFGQINGCAFGRESIYYKNINNKGKERQ